MTEENKENKEVQTPEGKVKEGENKEQQEEMVTYNGEQLPRRIVDGFNKRVAAEKAGLKKNYDTLSDEFNKLQTQMEEFKLSQMTDKEKQEHENKKREDEFNKLKSERDQGFSLFQNYKTETEIFNEVSNYDVFNPKQVVNLLKATYPIEFIKDEAGEYNILFKIGSDKLTVKDSVKKFLDDETNANLLRSTLKPGGGTSTKLSQPNLAVKTVFKRSELKDKEIHKQYSTALLQGLNPSIIDG